MEYILIIGLVVGFVLLFIAFNIHKQWMENTIDHKIKVHNESIYTIINACDKTVNVCTELNLKAKDYAESADKSIQEAYKIISDTRAIIESNKSCQSEVTKCKN